MNTYVKLNSDWLSHYDNTYEIDKIEMLTRQLGFSNENKMLIADIGCGNGRLTKYISKLFCNSFIYAIDIMRENLEYAKELNKKSNVKYICADAFDFFYDNPHLKFDLIFFSWSLFDMVSVSHQSEKEKRLEELISSTKNSLNNKGYIIVLQPTKGGDFEKLLSRFMPDSDEDYYITHKCLIKNGFHGPNTPFPEKDNRDAIWSRFLCDELQLFYGIASIVMLETGRLITKEEFNTNLSSFLCEYNIDRDKFFCLSDCVSVYYLSGGK